MYQTKYLFQLYTLITLCFLSGCDMIEYHPYDLDIDGETGINDKNIQEIEQSLQTKETISFAVISDTQRWYDETEDAVENINARNDIDFVIHTGDISDFGMKLEFEKQRDILNRLTVPYVCLLGNHDCLATGKEVFNLVFGKENYAFTAGDIRFICLNTNALEFDYTEAVPDFTFLRNELENLSPSIKKTVVAMHAAPYSEQFNNNTAFIFHEYIKLFPSLQFCIHGHGHTLSAKDLFEDGIFYYQCANIEKRSYLHFTITQDQYTYEVIDF